MGDLVCRTGANQLARPLKDAGRCGKAILANGPVFKRRFFEATEGDFNGPGNGSVRTRQVPRPYNSAARRTADHSRSPMVGSERTCAEIEPLRDVVVGFAGWDRVIDMQRAERRIPDQACSHGGADRTRIGGRERLRQPWKGGLASIAPEATGIHEKGPFSATPGGSPGMGACNCTDVVQ